MDAGVLIRANNDYYPIGRIPEFWAWLRFIGGNGHAKIAREFYEEVIAGRRGDPLLDWIRAPESKDALLLDEEADVGHVQNVIANGYAGDLTDDEVEQLGRTHS